MMCQIIGMPPISIIGLGLSVGFLGEARSQTAGKYYRFHCPPFLKSREAKQ